jgi:hypothetical protein
LVHGTTAVLGLAALISQSAAAFAKAQAESDAKVKRERDELAANAERAWHPKHQAPVA